jgi:hypothetical protein
MPAARVYPESQCGFRAGRSTIDMIFSVRQLQEKCQGQKKPLLLAFIDLTKAFDLVSRSGLFYLLKKISFPPSPKLHSIIISLHTDMFSTVSYDDATSDPFPINSGVKQGFVLAPTLWNFLRSTPEGNRPFRPRMQRFWIHNQYKKTEVMDRKLIPCQAFT